ncbi:Protein pangolin J [Fasciola gigantica]|uniref:Protein pangolin J n=1 Tax=Fasciola gigantica TaxID=46835 RepID=A0A504Z109_FASGI|nr:Protein pangolin J [Fasciola gigantica]
MEIACTDEVKVYKDEGEEEEQKKSSENLTEDKVGLVIEGEGQCILFSLPNPFPVVPVLTKECIQLRILLTGRLLPFS